MNKKTDPFLIVEEMAIYHAMLLFLTPGEILICAMLVSKDWLQAAQVDRLWEEMCQRFWREKHTSKQRWRWCIVSQTPLEGEKSFSEFPMPSFISNSSNQPRLSWAESYRSSYLDSVRTWITDQELFAHRWEIRFMHGRARSFPAIFFSDGWYTDSVFFKATSPIKWGIQGAMMRLAHGFDHQICRQPNWGWTMWNDFVVIKSSGLRDQPCGALQTGEDRDSSEDASDDDGYNEQHDREELHPPSTHT